MRASDVAQWLARPERVVLVATMDDAFAGYAHAAIEHIAATALTRADAVLHVHELAVLPEQRRRGIARALLRAMRGTAVAHGLATVSLDVYAFNADALALYEREGFAPLRTRLVAPASPTS